MPGRPQKKKEAEMNQMHKSKWKSFRGMKICDISQTEERLNVSAGENKPIREDSKLNLNLCHQQSSHKTDGRRSAEDLQKLKQGLLHVIHFSARH